MTWTSFYIEMADKLLGYKNNRKSLIDVIYSLDEKYIDYIKNKDSGIISDIDPFTVFGIFNRGIKQDSRFEICGFFKERLHIATDVPSDFDGVPVLNNMKAIFVKRESANNAIQHLWNLFEAVITNDRSEIRKAFDMVSKQHGIRWNITMGLFWIRPYDYIALDSTNRTYLPTLGVKVFNEKQIDSEHYLALIDDVKQKINDKSIKESNIPEISHQAWIGGSHNTTSDMSRHYWLVGYTYGRENSQIDRFFQEGIWECSYNDSSNSGQKFLNIAKSIKKGDIIILKSSSTKGTKHDNPFLRVKGVGVVEGDIKLTKSDSSTTLCACKVKYVSNEDKDFNGSIYGAYRKTIHQADSKIQTVIDYANGLLRKAYPEPMNKYQEYIDILKETHNLVLTGAPGTGKTYMAKTIATEMGCTQEEMYFVQFHPSYDYTDFVEGLRPIENSDGQLGFERKDGVFKEFCKRAIKNQIDSQKSIESLTKEMSWEENLQQFVEEAVENNTTFRLSNGNEFTIEEIKGRAIIVHNEKNEKTSRVSVNADDIIELLTNDVQLNIVRDIRNHFERKFGTQPDSYAFVITKEIRNIKKDVNVTSVNKIDRKPFVFIIDEINRGDVSKIFGELFYAIDPGYRGNKEVCVKTQYQNIVPETDVFANGFYVPDNVYILATMNDIDRSVESMDFAMRRRFTWKEVTPEDTLYMLDRLNCALEAKATIRRINKVIVDTEGLGAAYQIGPSYFLKLKDNGYDFYKLWKMNIEPLLKEYLRGFRKADEIMRSLYHAFFNTEAKVEEHEKTDWIDED